MTNGSAVCSETCEAGWARIVGPLPDDQQHSRDGADQMLTRITRRKRDHAAAERWHARQAGREATA